MTNVNSPRFWHFWSKPQTANICHFLSNWLITFIPGTVYKQNSGMLEKLRKKTLIFLIIICMRYLGYILGLITGPDQTSPTLMSHGTKLMGEVWPFPFVACSVDLREIEVDLRWLFLPKNSHRLNPPSNQWWIQRWIFDHHYWFNLKLQASFASQILSSMCGIWWALLWLQWQGETHI